MVPYTQLIVVLERLVKREISKKIQTDMLPRQLKKIFNKIRILRAFYPIRTAKYCIIRLSRLPL